MQTRTELKAALLITATMLCYAGNHVIGRAVHAEIPPLGLSFWRWTCGGLIILPLVWNRLPVLLPLYKTHWRLLALLGVLIVGSTSMVLVGLQFTSATNTSLINSIQPAATAILCWIFLHERLRALQWLGIGVAFVGIAQMIVRGDINTLFEIGFNPGDMIVLLAMLGFAAYAINIRRLPPQLSTVESLFAVIVFGTLAVLPLYLVETAWYKPVPIAIESLAAVVTLALLVSVLGMLMWTRGNQLVGANRAAAYINLLPIFGAGLAAVFLNEQIASYHVVGCVMIALGMWLMLRKGAKREPA
jgi:drug/metabolite transporter (DMT)-like permease